MTYQTQPSHIAVIGAGIIGASIAYHLARRGIQVTVFDTDQPGQGATALSFAWINGRNKDPRTYYELNRRAVDMWDRFARRLGTGDAIRWGGEMRWAATAAGAAQFRHRVALLQSWGYPIRALQADEVEALEPGLETGRVTAASFTEIDGQVDTAAVVRACLTQAEKLGAEVRSHTRVAEVILTCTAHQRRVAALRTAEGEELPCDAAVLAAGADAPALAAGVGVDMPLDHTFGATVITEPVAPIFEQVAVVHTAGDLDVPQLNFRQLGDGGVMVHGGSHGESLGRTAVEVEQMMELAARFAPALKGVEVREVRRGRRPMPADGHPILGFTQAVPNLYLAAMHSGVTLAPLVGELSALEIVDGARVEMLEPYRVERFA